MADTPFWVLVVLLVADLGGEPRVDRVAARSIADRRVPRSRCDSARPTLGTTAIIYAIGWGPMLVVAYGVGFAAVLQEAGSASWRSGFAWSVVGVLLGQIAIEAGIAPTLIDVPLSQRGRARRAACASASSRACSA